VFDRSTRGSAPRGPLPRTGGGVRVRFSSYVLCSVTTLQRGGDSTHVQQRERPPNDGNRSLHGVLAGARRTAADAEALDQRTEALDVLLGEVLQQPAALADQD